MSAVKPGSDAAVAQKGTADVRGPAQVPVPSVPEPTKSYKLKPGAKFHIAGGTAPDGSVVQLTDAQAVAFADRIER